ncbi:2741_t:CDS:1 [Gigaspora margarita]|uniref:2741_t:CDS:1 n=1 Tax=Gigaspora margarita TaxID=4874 RepID=A0ABN7V6P4_GIGMA|nr:2741_t:CDS:1 [Gigaspora margarita]
MTQNFLCDINNIINNHRSHGRFMISRNPANRYSIWSDCNLFVEIANTHSLPSQVNDSNLTTITWSGVDRRQPYRGYLFDKIHELFKVREKLIKDILKSITTNDNKNLIQDINNIILDHENCIVGPFMISSNMEETRSNCPAFLNATYPMAPQIIPVGYQNICLGNLWDTIIPLHYHLQSIEYYLLFLCLLIDQNSNYFTNINNIINKHKSHDCKFTISQDRERGNFWSVFSNCPLLIEIASAHSTPPNVAQTLLLITWATHPGTRQPFRGHVMVQIHELFKVREKLIKDILKSITTNNNKNLIQDINNIILDHKNCIVGPQGPNIRSNCPAFLNATFPLVSERIPSGYRNICFSNMSETLIPLHIHLRNIENFLLFLRLLLNNGIEDDGNGNGNTNIINMILTKLDIKFNENETDLEKLKKILEASTDITNIK